MKFFPCEQNMPQLSILLCSPAILGCLAVGSAAVGPRLRLYFHMWFPVLTPRPQAEENAQKAPWSCPVTSGQALITAA